MEGLEIKERFYLFELGVVHLILVVAWLASFGEVKINWRDLTTKFGQKNEKVVIKGDPTLIRKVASLEALLKETEIEVVTLVCGLGQLEEGSKGVAQLTHGQAVELEEVLGEYDEIFKEPTSLPPRRHLDHKIPIKEGWIRSM